MEASALACVLQGVIEFSLCLLFAKLVSYTFLFWLPLYITSVGESSLGLPHVTLNGVTQSTAPGQPRPRWRLAPEGPPFSICAGKQEQGPASLSQQVPADLSQAGGAVGCDGQTEPACPKLDCV